MVIAKVKGGYAILHATKKGEIGERINATKKPVTLQKVQDIHAAMILSKLRAGKALGHPKYKAILKKKGWVKKKYWEKK